MRLKTTCLLCFVFLCVFSCEEKKPSNVSTTDIDNFWIAYDKIKSTQDSSTQRVYLDSLFLKKASAGQKAMIDARRYTAEDYLYAINNYPKFWNSVRANTRKVSEKVVALEQGIGSLRFIYPVAKPAKVYFTMGALRSNGTTVENMVLIGSELALSDKSTVSSELPEMMSHLPSFFQTDPQKNLVFLNTHEYVHTQQKTTIGYNLLAQTVIEGTAEYLAEVALNQDSPNPQIAFGRENDQEIKAAFIKEMYSPIFSNWLWGSPNNQFGMRDLAYYVGYKICEGYYNNHKDKGTAIRKMIELDYNNEAKLLAFVDESGYFPQPVSSYQDAFEKSRPLVSGLIGITQNEKQVDPDLENLTVQFSEPMNTQIISTDLGELGLEHFPKIKKVEFSEDGTKLTYQLTLEPNKKYEMVMHWNMRNTAGIPLVADTIKFETGN